MKKAMLYLAYYLLLLMALMLAVGIVIYAKNNANYVWFGIAVGIALSLYSILYRWLTNHLEVSVKQMQ